jgi:hypothetical protein
MKTRGKRAKTSARIIAELSPKKTKAQGWEVKTTEKIIANLQTPRVGE